MPSEIDILARGDEDDLKCAFIHVAWLLITNYFSVKQSLFFKKKEKHDYMNNNLFLFSFEICSDFGLNKCLFFFRLFRLDIISCYTLVT